MKFINRKNILMTLLTLYGLACIVGVTRLATISGHIIRYGNFVFPVSSIQGIIATLNSLSCVILVFIDFRKRFLYDFCRCVSCKARKKGRGPGGKRKTK